MDNISEGSENRFVGYIGEGITNETLQCRDCKHCIKESILECEIYTEKPAGVLSSAKQCEDYESVGNF